MGFDILSDPISFSKEGRVDEDLTKIETYFEKRKEEVDDLDDAYSEYGFYLFRTDVEKEILRRQESGNDTGICIFIDMLVSNYRFECKEATDSAKEIYVKAAQEAMRMKERMFS